MRRMDQSEQVARAKAEAGEAAIYRPEREQEIFRRLAEGVPKERVAWYIAVVRKIMEASRMCQYDLLFDLIPDLFPPLAEKLNDSESDSRIVVRFACQEEGFALFSAIAMIGERGCKLERLERIGGDANEKRADYEAQFVANLNDPQTQKLLFQLYKETENFKIMKSF